MRALIVFLLAALAAFADVKIGVGSFTQGTAGGTTTVAVLDSSGVAFDPKFVTIVGSNMTATGAAAGAAMTYGMCGPSNTGKAVWNSYSDAAASSSAKRTSMTNRCIAVFNASGQIVAAATVTMGTGQFVVNWDTPTNADTVARKYYFRAIGGADITNVGCANLNITSGSPISSTSFGFRSSIIFFIASISTPVSYAVGSATSANNAFSFGATVGGGVATTFNGADASTAQPFFAQLPHSLMWLASTSSSINAEGDATITATGFDLTFVATTGVPGNIMACGIAGGLWAVGTFNWPTSGGAQSVSPVSVGSMTPIGAQFFSANAATTASVTASGAHHSFGFSDGTHHANVFYGTIGATAGGGTTKATTYTNTLNILTLLTTNGASPTVNGSIDAVAYADTTITPHVTATTGTAYEVGYVVVGNPRVTTGKQWRIIN